VVYGTYLLPPVHFLGGHLLGIGDDIYTICWRFWVFVAYIIGYSAVLTVVYIFWVRRKKV